MSGKSVTPLCPDFSGPLRPLPSRYWNAKVMVCLGKKKKKKNSREFKYCLIPKLDCSLWCMEPGLLFVNLSRILNTVIMRDRSIPFLLKLNSHGIILKNPLSPVPLMQCLHGWKNNPYKSCLNDLIGLKSHGSLDWGVLYSSLFMIVPKWVKYWWCDVSTQKIKHQISKLLNNNF